MLARPRSLPGGYATWHRWAALAAFVAIVGATICRHEMWLDEMNTWDVVRDAANLPGLFGNMHYEVHPALWYLCLYPVTRLTSNPFGMQLLHLAMATGTAAIILWKAPFSLGQRVLLVFGYFFAFEFAVISRNYALGTLALVAACALYLRSRPPLAPIVLLLAAAANSSFYSLLVATAAAAGMLSSTRLGSRRARGVAALAYLAAAALAMLTTYPASDNLFATEWHTRLEWRRVFATLGFFWSSYVPLPDFRSPSPWNSNILTGAWMPVTLSPAGALPAVLGAALFGAGILMVGRQRTALTTYILGSLAVASFPYLKYSGGLRHHGHLFIVLVVAVWMARADRDAASAPAVAHRHQPAPPRFSRQLLRLVLLSQVAAAAFFLVADLRGPFSEGRALADFLEARPRQSRVLVAHQAFLNFAGPVLSGYLRAPVPYVLSRRIVAGSFMLPNSEHRAGATEEEIVRQVRQEAARGSDVYVVTNNWTPTGLGPRVAHFDHHLEGDERAMDVYLVRAPTRAVAPR